MRVVVTGGAGFIGSHVVEQLLGRGDEVLVLDDLSRGRRRNVRSPARLVMADVATAPAAAALTAFRPQAVVHLAAQMDVGASVRAPEHDAHVNVLGTVRMLRAALEAGAEVFVSASSGGAIYGDAETLPTPESAAVQPRSPYGASKACSELYLELWARMGAMRCVSLRLSNVYGPRQSAKGESGVVAIFAECLARAQAPTVYGDGGQERDFVYVGDVARATLAALDAPGARGAINVGTGAGTSLLQLWHALCAGASRGAPTPAPQFAPGKPGEVRVSRLCVGRAARLLDWRPTTPLAEGLALTVAQRQRGARTRRGAPRPQLPGYATQEQPPA